MIEWDAEYRKRGKGLPQSGKCSGPPIKLMIAEAKLMIKYSFVLNCQSLEQYTVSNLCLLDILHTLVVSVKTDEDGQSRWTTVSKNAKVPVV